jgi:hypothetical protein
MKWSTALLPVTAAVILAWSGCARKADLAVQTAELEKVFPGLAAAVAAQAQATGEPATDDAKGCVAAAICAARRNDVATGVNLLRRTMRTTQLTPDQIMALQELRKAWVIDLTSRAAKGDEGAKAALAAIESAS